MNKDYPKLDTSLVESFTNLFLKNRYDGSYAIPDLHREWWDMCTSNDRLVAIAAPRGHAKTTAITLAYTLTAVLFRHKKYVLLVGNNEDTALELLGMLRNELKTNEHIKDVFEIKEKWDRDLQSDIIVTFEDGYRFRILAKGAQQKVRGRNWDGTRPDLIVIDDLEDDEQVESDERRRKLKNWVLKALLPAMSRKSGQVRYVGTILHEGSMLMQAIKGAAWTSKLYKAHRSFDDFRDLLWPEVWTEEALRAERQIFIDSDDPEGYSQEYLNDPSDVRRAFFKREDMLPMSDSDRNKRKTYYVACDFALSDKTYSDYSVILVGGYDEDGIVHVVDLRRLKTDDVLEIVEELFSVLDQYSPEYFIYEKGTLANAITPPLLAEMTRRNKFAHIETFNPGQDKRARAHPIQHRLRAGAVKFDTEADWYPILWEEMRKFPKADKRDQVDALAWLGIAINEFIEAPTQEEVEADEWEQAWESSGLMELDYDGTGY